MKKVLTLTVALILCLSLLLLVSCSSNAFKPDDSGQILIGVRPTSNSTDPNNPDSSATSTAIPDYNFKFELNEDGASYRVVDNGIYNGTSVVIPATYNDKPVTTVADYAFRNCKFLESVTFSENVNDVAVSAFYACTLITEIKVVDGNSKYKSENNCLIEIATDKLVLGCDTSVIPDYVTSIGEHAFYECSKLKSVEISANVTYISEKAYYKCTAIESIRVSTSNTYYTSRNSSNVECNCLIEIAPNKILLTCRWSNIPSDVSGYGEYAFTSNTNVQSIVIPSGTTTISEDMLKGCTNLESISIPASVTSISGYAFRECKNLRNIHIDAANPKYECVNGCVIDKTDNSLVLGACNAVIPNYVSKIKPRAFSGRNIESITIPASVTEIGNDAFYKCLQLTSAVFAVTEGWYTLSYIYADVTPTKDYIDVGRIANSGLAAAILTGATSAIYRD